MTRHGETDANVQGILQGWLDIELNKKGLTQATEAAHSFHRPIDAIFSSDLKRATRTALEFRKYDKNIPYFEDARLRLRDFGDAAGTYRDGHDLDQFWSIEDRSTIPNAEILNDFTSRLIDFLKELESKPYESVLIVTHGNVINRIQTIFNPGYKSRPQENMGIIEVNTKGLF